MRTWKVFFWTANLAAMLLGIVWATPIGFAGIFSRPEEKRIEEALEAVGPKATKSCKDNYIRGKGSFGQNIYWENANEDCEKLQAHFEDLKPQLVDLCQNAGEKIIKTEENVEGVYFQRSAIDTENREGFHYNGDKYYSSYIHPLVGRPYIFYELDSLKTPGMIDHFEPEGNNNQELDKPKAIYGFTYRWLTSLDQRKQGLYGEELRVFHIETHETLALRTFYFISLGRESHVVNKQGKIFRAGGVYPFLTCRRYRPEAGFQGIHGLPRDSYLFVSKVLKPKPLSQELAKVRYQFYKGMGRKTGECLGVKFGEEISIQDIELSRVGPNQFGLEIRLRGSEDVLSCGNFFHPAMKDFVRRSHFLFEKGDVFTYPELEEKIGIRK